MLSTPDAPRANVSAADMDEHGRDTVFPDMAAWHDLLEAVEDHGRGVQTLSPFMEEWAVKSGLPIPAFGTDPGYRLYPSAR